MFVCCTHAPSTMLRMIPLPRNAGEDEVSGGAKANILPAEAGRMLRRF